MSLFIPVALIGGISFTSLVDGFGTRFIDEDTFKRTILASSLFILIFMETHKLIIDAIPQKRIDLAFNSRFSRSDLRSYTLIFIGFSFLIVGLIIRYNLGFLGRNPWSEGGTISFTGSINAMSTSSMQLFQLFQALEKLALIIAGGVYVSRAKNFYWASSRFIFIFIAHLMFFFITTTERGGSLMFGLGVLCYTSMISPIFNGIKPWHLALGILIGFLLNLLTAIFETNVLGGNFDRWEATGLILRGPTAVFWITAMVIDWVDNTDVAIRNGKTYLQAIGGLFPGQIRPFDVGSLSKWFVNEFNPNLAKRGIGYGFSLIAEGYLNFKMMGVIISSLILALISSFLVFIRDSSRLPSVCILIYTFIFSGFYKFLQGDLSNLFSSLQYGLVVALIFVAFLSFMSKIKTLNKQ